VARRPSLFSPALFLRRNALHKGLLGGDRGWMLIGALVWGPRLLKRVMGRTEQVVATEKLVAGEFVRLEVFAAPTRRQRKALARGK
jgi:hypothetical protein